MRGFGVAAAGAVAAALLLSGCTSPTAAIVGPTTAEVTAYNQRELDRTFASAGLSGHMAPLTTSSRSLKGSAWSDALFGCLSDSGLGGVGISWGGTEGYQLADGSTFSVADRDALYRCIAENPKDPVSWGELYSSSQLEYLWTYWHRWVMPCLALSGYPAADAPTREIFLSKGGPRAWNPYYSVAGTSDAALMPRLEKRCGTPFGAIPEPKH